MVTQKKRCPHFLCHKVTTENLVKPYPQTRQRLERIETHDIKLVRIHTLMTGQVMLVILLAILSARMYHLLSIQILAIGMLIQAPLLTEPIWTGMMLHNRIHNHCETQMRIKAEEESTLTNQTKNFINQHKTRHNQHQDSS